MNSEIIFVNDASKDGSYELLRELEVKDKTVKVLNLTER